MPIQISTRIDEATKVQFESICQSIGTTPSNALSMLISGMVNHNGMPFTPTVPASKPRKMTMQETKGCLSGKIWMSDDFDEPLDDFKEYME